jgi:hypothetical protein
VPAPAPATNKRSVGITGIVSVANGAIRGLAGFYSISFTPPGDEFVTPDKGVLIATPDGGGSGELILEPGVYTVRTQYQARTSDDLLLLREPQRESLGFNGDILVKKALDLFQQDLADQLAVSATSIRPATIFVTAATSFVQVAVTAEVAESTQAQFDLSFNIGEEFTLTSDGKVSFDSSRLGDVAEMIADRLKGSFGDVLGDAANFVANALMVFSISTNIGAGEVLRAGANGKVTLSFKPCFLKDFALTATTLA